MSDPWETLRLLADPTRSRMLQLLHRGELAVGELQEILGLPQSRISTHLALLRKAQLVLDRRDGKKAFYALAKKEHLRNLTYILGNIEKVPLPDRSIDLALLSQALHHAENPRLALAEAFRILKPGGRLLILDLRAHRFEKARELYADRWLGFKENELHDWIEEAGFRQSEVRVVAKEVKEPCFETILATGMKPGA